MLNTYIHVKSTEGILSEQQTNQESDEEEDKHEEAITQKQKYREGIEYLTALRCFMENISEVLQQVLKTLQDIGSYSCKQREKKYYKQSALDNFFKNLNFLCSESISS
jgi:hypothetical protein